MPRSETPRDRLAAASPVPERPVDHEALLWEQIAREELDADFISHVFAVEKEPRTRRSA